MVFEKEKLIHKMHLVNHAQLWVFDTESSASEERAQVCGGVRCGFWK